MQLRPISIETNNMNNKRIIVIDDDPEIRQVYQEILAPDPNQFTTRHQMSLLLNKDYTTEINSELVFDLNFASNGQDGFALVERAIKDNTPYALAFIDIRMPPGWDGMETAAKIRQIDKHIELAIVTAYSDRSREEIVQAVGAPEKLLFFRKPFDPEEIIQLALSLTTKWSLARKEERQRQELEISENRFRSLAETTSDWIWETDKEGNCIYCSPACEKIFGYQPEELLNRNILDLLTHPDQLVEFRSFFYRCIQENRNFTGIQKFSLRKDGQPIYTEVSGVPITDTSAKVLGIRGIERDISPRKLQEKALMEAKISAEAANQAKSEFLANMSHEIRTPLNGVIGMTDLLMATGLTAEQMEYAETIHHSAGNLLELIDDILDLSKIEAGRLKIESVKFDLRKLTEKIANQFAINAKEKGLAFNIRFNPATPQMVVGDPGRLRQILVNLVSNAIKFTHKGHITLNVSCKKKDDKNTFLYISVEDTGIGVAPSKLHHIFDYFTQADSSTTRQYGGTGLGLTICQQLTNLMNGSIEVSSELGKGSTFSVLLPLREQDVSVPEIAFQPTTELSDLRILIFEPNILIRNELQQILSDLEIDNEAVETSKDAIRVLLTAQNEGKPFHIVILNGHPPDQMLPPLVKEIQSNVTTNCPLLISLLSNCQPVDKQTLSATGITACITTPVDRSQLADILVTSSKKLQNELTEPIVIPQEKKQTGDEGKKNTTSLIQLGAKILLAEDNPVNQKVAVRLLEKMGCTVYVAENGNKALDMITRDNYDLILMDCQMPELDGYETTAAIRKLEGPKRNIPIVALTANAMKGDRERCLAAGMNDYISKPVKAVTLNQTIQRWLKQEGGVYKCRK